HFELRQGCLRLERVSVGELRDEASWNPQGAFPFRANVELLDELGQLGNALRRQQRLEAPADQILAGKLEDLLRRRIYPRHAQRAIELDDGIHRAVDEPAQLFLALADVHFTLQTL